MILLEKSNYHLYLEWCNATNYGDILYEGKILDNVAKVLDFAKQVSLKLSLKLKDLFKLFSDKDTYKFFSELEWNFESFLKLVSAGSKVLNFILNPVQGILTTVFPDILSKKITNLKSFSLAKDQVKKVKDWMLKNKKVLIMSGVAFAGLYIIIWLTMSNSGDATYDYDLSDLFSIITGKLTFLDFISSEEGIKQIILFFIGLISGGLVVNVAKNSTLILISFLTTIASAIGTKLSKGKDSKSDIDKIEKQALQT